MTIYVDDMRLPARVGRLSARLSHPYADTDAELHRLAASIGLRRSWFQDEWKLPHYDVTDSKRCQAIAAGAVPVSWRDTGRWVAARLTGPGTGAAGLT